LKFSIEVPTATILIMSFITCPECKHSTKKGSYYVWQILIAICYFSNRAISSLSW